VPTYYFIIRARDGSYDDPSGTNLPDVEAATAYANRIIDELVRYPFLISSSISLRGRRPLADGRSPPVELKEGGHDPQYLTLDVKDEGRKTILSVPFNEG
jgi:hypothetical protein